MGKEYAVFANIELSSTASCRVGNIESIARAARVDSHLLPQARAFRVAEAVQRVPASPQREHDIGSGHGLAVAALHDSRQVAQDLLRRRGLSVPILNARGGGIGGRLDTTDQPEVLLQCHPQLGVDVAADALHAAPAGQAADVALGDAVDVVPEDLPAQASVDQSMSGSIE